MDVYPSFSFKVSSCAIHSLSHYKKVERKMLQNYQNWNKSARFFLQCIEFSCHIQTSTEVSTVEGSAFPWAESIQFSFFIQSHHSPCPAQLWCLQIPLSPAAVCGVERSHSFLSHWQKTTTPQKKNLVGSSPTFDISNFHLATGNSNFLILLATLGSF